MSSERPLECSQCKKKIEVEYKEINQNSSQTLLCCGDCPVLFQKVLGSEPEKPSKTITDTIKESRCSKCKTSESDIKSGLQVGCEECYVMFGEILSEELNNLGKIASNTTDNQQKHHVGTYNKDQDKLSDQISSLMKQLNSAIEEENYEHAAWLRDRIQELKKDK